MKLSRCRRLASVLIAVVLVQACTTVPATVEPPGSRADRYESRAARLSALPEWSLRARLAVSDGDDGGSGSLRWAESGDGSRMDFHGALGRGAWRLDAGLAGAELELADGSLYRAETVDELLRERLGWEIPVDSLAWWVRGLEAPGRPGSANIGEDGTLESLEQDGWSIEFGRYREFAGIDLPVKMTARQAERTVKIAVREWELTGAND